MKKIKMPVEFYDELYAYQIEWLNKNIEGKYLVDESDLVEVNLESGNGDWVEMFSIDENKGTHKAYLIKSSIEPIKKETAEDVLKQILERWHCDESGVRGLEDLRIRAKKALEEK